MTDERRLAQSTAPWDGGDVTPGRDGEALATPGASEDLAEAVTVDDRGSGSGGGRARVDSGAIGSERYQLVGELGRGGMAVVHEALDRQLGRKVALKLVRPDRVDAAGRARLLREAQTLAQLRHPNVVTVFDAGTRGDQVFVAMELIDGGSLTRWLTATPRAWPAIVRMFVGAGRGLAAAHAAGLVHRDFKPDNVLVDRDDTPHVADFGLAVPTGDDDHEARTSAAASAERPGLAAITHTGVVVGTPAFMAPEQLAGEPATAAADQFAFCVALHRALHGAAPFAGDTLAALRASIEAGRIVEPTDGRGVPAWLTTAVRRGLAARPDDRHPSMLALVELLARERGWRRWRLPVLGGAAVLATGVAIAFAATRPDAAKPEARCDGGATELAAVWSPALRASLAARFDAIATPLARDARERTLGALDDRARAWSTMHRAACVDHARGAQSDRTLDLRMRCLHQRKDELAAATAVLARTDAATVSNAVDVAVRLAPVADCGDLELLASELPPPATAEGRARADALRTRLAQVEALDHAGRSEEAVAAVVPIVADARALDDPGTLIAALLAQGRIHLGRMEVKQAAPVLREVEQLALSRGATRSAVEAGARAIFVDAIDARRPVPELLAQASVLEPLSLTLRDRFARPLLLNNLGVVHMSNGDPEAARASFQAAHDALGGQPPVDLELLVIDRNLAMTTADRTERARLLRTAWERTRDALGPHHLTSLDDLAAFSHFAPTVAEAADAMAASTAELAENHPALVERRAVHGVYAAFLASERDDAEAAARAYARVVALPAGAETAPWRDIAVVASAPRPTDDALALLARVEREHHARTGWWEQLIAGTLAQTIAEARVRRGESPRADATRALALFDSIASATEDLELELRQARARALLEGTPR